MEAYRKLTDDYHQALLAREEKIKRFYDWSSDVKLISAKYTITESDVNNYSVSQMPNVAKDRMAKHLAQVIKKNYTPVPVYDENGVIKGYVLNLEVKQKHENLDNHTGS